MIKFKLFSLIIFIFLKNQKLSFCIQLVRHDATSMKKKNGVVSDGQNIDPKDVARNTFPQKYY